MVSSGGAITTATVDSALKLVLDDIYSITAVGGLKGATFIVADTGLPLNLFWMGNETAGQVMRNIMKSEPNGVLFERNDGLLRFINSGGIPSFSIGQMEIGDRTYFRPTRVRVNPRQDEQKVKGTLTTYVYNLEAGASVKYTSNETAAGNNGHLIRPKEVHLVVVNLNDPLSLVFGPTAAVDYQFMSTAGGGGPNLNANLSVTLRNNGQQLKYFMVNTGAVNGYLTAFQSRTQAYIGQAHSQEIMIGDRNLTAKATGIYGAPVFSVDAKYSIETEALVAYMHWGLYNSMWQVPDIEVEFLWTDDIIAERMLSLELYTPINYDDRQSDVSSRTYEYMVVNGIKHEFHPGDIAPKTTLQLHPTTTHGYKASVPILRDRFIRGLAGPPNLTFAESGHAWNTGNIVDEQGARGTGAGFNTAWAELGASDAVIFDRFGDFNLTPSGTGDVIGVLLRYSNTGTYLIYEYYPDASGGTHRLDYWNGAAAVNLAIVTNVRNWFYERLNDSLQQDNYMWVKVECRGARIRVWINFDPEPIIDVITQLNRTETKFGITTDRAVLRHNAFLCAPL